MEGTPGGARRRRVSRAASQTGAPPRRLPRPVATARTHRHGGKQLCAGGKKEKRKPAERDICDPFENQMEKSNQQPASSSCPTAGLGSATATEEEKMPPFLLKENHGRCAKHCFFLRYVLCTELPAEAQLSFPDHINQTQMPSLFLLAACSVSQPL